MSEDELTTSGALTKQQALLVRDNPNNELWFTFYDTDQQMVKEADKGSYKFHTVDATYTRYRATALWGPYGDKWGLKDIQYEFTKEADGRLAEMVMLATFYYPGPNGQRVEFPIINDWPWRRAAETAKKLQTNTLNKALSYLGFSADIWDGKFEDDPYLEYQTGGLGVKAQKAEDVIGALSTAADLETLERYWSAAQQRGLNRHNYGRAKTAYQQRKTTLEAGDLFGGSDEHSQEDVE